MIPYIGHPSFDDLNRYADGELGDDRKARVAAHLADCSECRRSVATIRDLAQTARTIPVPVPPEDSLDRILARRDAGERVLLPVKDIGAPGRRRPVAATVAAAAAVMAFLLVGLAVWAPTARADLSRLVIAPERPAPGQLLELSYDGSALFPDQDRLIVRARYRTAGGEERLGSVGHLLRDDDGFQGSIDLPDDVVYAAFAVEDLAARQVDSNGRRFWEVLVHEDGKPTYAALRARADELERRDLTEAYTTIRRMTELYPGEVEGWLRRLTLEKSAYLGGARDSVIDLHWRQFQRFEHALERTGADPADIAWMAAYAEALEHPRAPEWLERARRDAPGHEATVRLRIAEQARATRRDLAALFSFYDSLWTTGHRYHWMAQDAFVRALRSGAHEAARRWADRYEPTNMEEALRTAEWLAGQAETRDRGVRALQDVLVRLRSSSEADRALYATDRAQSEANQPLVQQALVAIGTSLLEVPEREQDALQSLRAALDEGWNRPALTEVARIHLDQGLREVAVDALARVAVQPSSEIADPDLLQLMDEARESPEWRRTAADIGSRFRRHIMSGAVIRPSVTSGDLSLHDVGGQTVPMARLAVGHANVVVVLTPFALRHPEALRDLSGLAHRLEETSTPLIPVYLGEPTAELATFLERQPFGLELYFDPAGRLSNALNAIGSPDYFILDERGRIRFEHLDPDDVVNAAGVLQSVATAYVAARVE